MIKAVIFDFFGVLYETKEESGLNKKLLDFIDNELRRKYKIGIISNAGVGTIESIMPERLLDLFDRITVSGEVGVMKPNREIYDAAIKKLGMQPQECIFIDDFLDYATSASEFGMRGITYTGFNNLKSDLRAILNSEGEYNEQNY